MSAPLGIRCCSLLTKSRTPHVLSHQIFILLFTFFVYVSYHLSRKPISVVKDVLHCNLSSPDCPSNWKPFDGDDANTLLGFLDLAYLSTYAIGMFISGHIAERTNMRYFLAAGMTLSGVTTILFGLAQYWHIHTFAYFVIIQLICGLFQSTGWPPVVAVVANWFGKARRGLVYGLWNSHTYVGNIRSLIAGAFLSKAWNYNWGLSFIVPGLIIIGMALLVLLFLTPHPSDLGITVNNSNIQDHLDQSETVVVSDETVEGNSDEAEPLLHSEERHQQQPLPASEMHAISFLGALRIPGVIEFSLSLFFAKFVSYTFLYWLPQYIHDTNNVDQNQAADLSTLFDVGGIVGGVFAGVISDITGGRAVTCIVMMVIALPMMVVYEFFGATNLIAMAVQLLVTGAMVNGPYSLITTAVSADLGTHPCLHGNAKALATVSAIIDGTGSIGAAIGPQLAGILSRSGWHYVFCMLITAEFAALLLLMRLGFKETQLLCCQRSYSQEEQLVR